MCVNRRISGMHDKVAGGKGVNTEGVILKHFSAVEFDPAKLHFELGPKGHRVRLLL